MSSGHDLSAAEEATRLQALEDQVRHLTEKAQSQRQSSSKTAQRLEEVTREANILATCLKSSTQGGAKEEQQQKESSSDGGGGGGGRGVEMAAAMVKGGGGEVASEGASPE